MKIEREITTPAGRRLNGNWLAVRNASRGGVHLIHGPRGSGKSTAALIALAPWMEAGAEVLVTRQTFPAMRNLWETALKIFAGYGIRSRRSPQWEIAFPAPAGRLTFRPIRCVDDVRSIQGHGYAAALVDELPMMAADTWADLTACLRCPDKRIPVAIIGTANPYGDDRDPAGAAMGAEWVYPRFIKNRPAFQVSGLDGGAVSEFARGLTSVAHYPTQPEDNPVLLAAQPAYWSTLAEALKANPRKRAAWVEGRWTSYGGSAFEHVWDPDRQVLPSPLLCGCKIPQGWRLIRSLDWGISEAWCYLLIGVSDGRSPLRCGADGAREALLPRGTVVALAEIYGWDWTTDTGLRLPAGAVAAQIAEFEGERFAPGRIRPGPGDLIGDREAAGEFDRAGVPFLTWRKPPGSRAEGFRLLLAALWNSSAAGSERPVAGAPALYVTEACPTLIRYLPLLPQAPGQDDILQPARKVGWHDHPYDALRYPLQYLVGGRVAGGVTGVLT